jgi:25S rRNA (uracil2634-N3)-methyltransferase
LRNPIIPFKASDRILLIGEGNFSFARALIDHPPRDLDSLPPENITATAYDTEEECYNKYPECPSIVTFLRDRGVEVVFGVDATRLERHLALKGRYWDRIIWNFPHAGASISEAF